MDTKCQVSLDTQESHSSLSDFHKMHHPLSELPVRSRPSSIIIILHNTGGACEEPDTAKALPILGTCATTAELDSNSPAPWAKVLTQSSVTTSSKDRKQRYRESKAHLQ